MEKKLAAGFIRPPGDKIRRFREGIPKTKAEVAADADVNERTISNVENSEPVSYRTLERVAIGLGVRYRTLLAVARGEIDSLDEEAKPRFRVTITIEGDMEGEALNKHREYLARLASAIESLHPFADNAKVTKGSVIISFDMHSDDMHRMCTAFLDGRLERLGIRELQMHRHKMPIHVLLIYPRDNFQRDYLNDPDIIAKVADTVAEANSVAEDPSLDAIVVTTTRQFYENVWDAELPIFLNRMNSRGLPVLLVGEALESAVRLYGAFPNVPAPEDVLPKLRQWVVVPLRRRHVSIKDQGSASQVDRQ